MNRWIFILLTFVGLHSLAQHPFYLQIFEEAKLAMAAGDHEQAAQDLEIAAFGFLDKEPLLTEAYIRLVLTHKALNQQEKADLYLRDVNRLLEKLQSKPAGLSQSMWDSFLVASGRKAPPAPPVPVGEAALLNYVESYPDNTDAWMALIDTQLATRKVGKLRKTFGKAMDRHPENARILAKALIFSMNQDKGRGSEALANKLLILKPDSPMANEVLGGAAVGKSAWDQAAAHYQLVPVPQFPKTPDYQRRLQRALERQKAAEEKLKQPEELQPEPVESEILAQEQPTSDVSDSSSKTPIQNNSEGEEQPPEIQPSPETTDAPIQIIQNELEVPEEIRNAHLNREKKPMPEAMVEKVVSAEPQIDYQAQVDALERQARQEPGNPDLKFDLVSAYVNQGDMRKAKKQLARLARRYNNHPRYAETYAHYQYAQGAYQVNIDNLAAFQNDLQGKSAYYLGMSYYQVGRLEEAKTILKRLDAKQFEIPADVALQNTKASASGGGFQQVQTVSTLSRQEAIQWLSDMTNQGNWDVMNRDLGQIIARYPADQDVRFFQARALMGKGSFTEAMPFFIELVGEGYEANEIFYHAGITALRKGDTSVANYLFERAQANNSRFSDEIKALLADGQ